MTQTVTTNSSPSRVFQQQQRKGFAVRKITGGCRKMDRADSKQQSSRFCYVSRRLGSNRMEDTLSGNTIKPNGKDLVMETEFVGPHKDSSNQSPTFPLRQTCTRRP